MVNIQPAYGSGTEKTVPGYCVITDLLTKRSIITHIAVGDGAARRTNRHLNAAASFVGRKVYLTTDPTVSGIMGQGIGTTSVADYTGSRKRRSQTTEAIGTGCCVKQ